MKKGGFTTNNPALNFMSVGVDEEGSEREKKQQTKNRTEEQKNNMLTSQKYVIQKEVEKVETPTKVSTVYANNKQYYKNPEYIEKKTRRVQLMFTPSLYEKVQVAAQQEGMSVNEYIQRTLKSVLGEQ